MAAIQAAGAYNYRATGVLGDKRDTMLVNEIHARVNKTKTFILTLMTIVTVERICAWSIISLTKIYLFIHKVRLYIGIWGNDDCQLEFKFIR